MKIRRVITWAIVVVVILTVIVVTGASVFMLKYSLGPNPWRQDTEGSYRRLFEFYPETRPWVDSLRCVNALRDTFVTMPTGERHHALYVWRGSRKTALVLHGWRGCSIDFLFLARMYERDFGYNVVVPDFHAHGLSDGDTIGMGWLDRKDMLHWLTIFQICFIDDCGYTSVWDEFTKEMRDRFGLPQFPLMYTGSVLCKLLYGWSFGEASALRQVARSPYPMLFIHGDNDTFVPSEMVHPLYEAKQGEKEIWITKGTEHARSYADYREEYVKRIKTFLGLL